MIEHNIPLRENYILSDRDLKTGIQTPVVLPIVMPTAFVCNCDETACMLITQLKHLGYRVPEDISVLGFDDIDPASSFIPPLTTCGAPAEKIASTLLEALFSGAEPGLTIIDMDLIVRGTCAKK